MRRRELLTLLGGAVTWSLTARAQQPAMPIVGFMSGRSPDDSARVASAFRQGSIVPCVEERRSRDEKRTEVAVLVGVGGDVSAVPATCHSHRSPNDPPPYGLLPNMSESSGTPGVNRARGSLASVFP